VGSGCQRVVVGYAQFRGVVGPCRLDNVTNLSARPELVHIIKWGLLMRTEWAPAGSLGALSGGWGGRGGGGGRRSVSGGAGGRGGVRRRVARRGVARRGVASRGAARCGSVRRRVVRRGVVRRGLCPSAHGRGVVGGGARRPWPWSCDSLPHPIGPWLICA